MRKSITAVCSRTVLCSAVVPIVPIVKVLCSDKFWQVMGCDMDILRGLSTSYRKFDQKEIREQVRTSFGDPKTATMLRKRARPKLNGSTVPCAYALFTLDGDPAFWVLWW